MLNIVQKRTVSRRWNRQQGHRRCNPLLVVEKRPGNTEEYLNITEAKMDCGVRDGNVSSSKENRCGGYSGEPVPWIE